MPLTVVVAVFQSGVEVFPVKPIPQLWLKMAESAHETSEGSSRYLAPVVFVSLASTSWTSSFVLTTVSGLTEMESMPRRTR